MVAVNYRSNPLSKGLMLSLLKSQRPSRSSKKRASLEAMGACDARY